jgi:2-polyprenyl-3-methyl-5-hydroxy-6-metoxy-1,4-benzoquinol methylase
MTLEKRLRNEQAHGKWLAANDPEKQWDWATPAGRRRAKRRADLIMQGACLREGMRVLEIGCGTGMFTEIFAASKAKILAVDLSSDLLALAAHRGLRPDQVTFLQSPFEHCAEYGPFDAIIGSSILHHLDCKISFPKIYKLLKRKGRISFCEPNMMNPQIWFTYTFRRFFPYISPDENAFYRKILHRNLQNSGFSNISITPFDWLHPRTPKKFMYLIEHLGRKFENYPLIKEISGSLHIVAIKL